MPETNEHRGLLSLSPQQHYTNVSSSIKSGRSVGRIMFRAAVPPQVKHATPRRV